MVILDSVTARLKRVVGGIPRSSGFVPVGASVLHNKPHLLFKDGNERSTIAIASDDGYSFERKSPPAMSHALSIDSSYVFLAVAKKHPLLYFSHPSAGKNSGTAVSFLSARRQSQPETVSGLIEPYYINPGIRSDDTYFAFAGDRSIQLLTSTDLLHWEEAASALITSPLPTQVLGAFARPEAIVLVYAEKMIQESITVYNIHIAYLDKHNPQRILWHTEQPILRQRDLWPSEEVRPFGCILWNNAIHIYWVSKNKSVFASTLSGFLYNPEFIKRQLQLEKHPANPIIEPHDSHDWEAFNVFNPAAVYVNDKVHILYRAQGFDYVSSVGYASSSDGITISERLSHPVYSPTERFEHNVHETASKQFISGGGFGGCEDPRITLIDNRLYMTYVAFDGWSPPRLALTSIELEDFLRKRWHWTKPVLISPPGIVDKSGCILPEKIRGKYVLFHRVFPNILIDFVDNLNFDGKTRWLQGQYKIEIRPDKWDSRKIGAGAPPIKTKKGWLLIYYGVDDRDAGKYHIGAMLLDLKDPTKVLHRSNHPILQPTHHYEQSGFKPGVAYPCGAVVVKEKLLVYYGAADSTVCVATANLETFLNDLTTTEEAQVNPVIIREIEY